MLFASRRIKVFTVSSMFGYDISWDKKCSEIHWTVLYAFFCSCKYMRLSKILETLSKDQCPRYLQTNEARSPPWNCANTAVEARICLLYPTIKLRDFRGHLGLNIITGLFFMGSSETTCGNNWKLRQGRFRLDLRKYLFTGRVVKLCKNLPRTGDASTSQCLRGIWTFCQSWSWTRWLLLVPSDRTILFCVMLCYAILCCAMITGP